MKRCRVILFGTGFVGHLALRAIIERPHQFELVGVWVHSPKKVGLDAGDIAKTAKTGILATNNIDELIALRADCLCSAAAGNLNEEWMTDVHCRFLEAGTNVVSTSVTGMIYPPASVMPDFVRRIERAALRGRASFLTSGMDPGYSSDFALNLSQMCDYWTQIRIQEIYDYSTYLPTGAADLFSVGLGFGQPMDYLPRIFTPGTLTAIWGGPTVTLVADALGVKLDEIREMHWRHATDETFEVEKIGTIKKGTQEAYRFEVQGFVDGKVAVIAEHITRLRKGSAPQWSSGESGEGYYVQIDGYPGIKGHVSFTGPDGDHQYGAILGTGMKVVNAILDVCSARPGILASPIDLPPQMGRGAYRAVPRR